MDRPTLDTGRLKSGWTVFWIGPFALFAILGFLVIGADVVRHGFSESWLGQVIGLVMLLGFAILLSWVFLRGFSRERVWLSDGSIRILRSSLTMRDEVSLEITAIDAFEVAAAEAVFDIRLRTKDGRYFPVVTAHRIRELDHWTTVLGQIAPVRSAMVRMIPRGQSTKA